MSRDNGFKEWGGYMEAKITKLEEQFSSAKDVMRESDLFEGISIYVNGLTDPSADDLKRIMMVHGGTYHHYERSHTSYIIASNLPDVKVRNMNTSKIVKPQWIVDCVREKRILNYTNYLLCTEQKTSQPRLTFKRKEPANTKADAKTHTVEHKNGQVTWKIPELANDIKNEDRTQSEPEAKTAKGNNTSPLKTGTKSKVKTESKPDTRDPEKPIEDATKSKANTKSPENVSSSLNSLNSMLRTSTVEKRNLLADMVVKPASSLSVQNSEKSAAATNKSLTTAKSLSAATSSAGFIEEYFRNSRLHYISTMGEEFKQYIFDLRDRHGDNVFPARKTLKELLLRERMPESDENFGPLIMHIDMDCFFVSVGLRKYPSLRGKPVVVTHSKGGKSSDNVRARPGTDRKQEAELLTNNPKTRLPSDKIPDEVLRMFQTEASMSEIASCSYEARARGVRNGMFVGLARTMCPELVTIPYDFDAYREVAHALYDTVAQYTLDVEAVSLDEMYVDLEGVLAELKVPPMYFVSALRAEVFRKTGCTCSAGVGANRLQARIATKRAKPDGQFHLLPADVIPVFSDMSVRELPGVGRSMASTLKDAGIMICEHLRKTPVGQLQLLLGKTTGTRLHENAAGIDSRTLEYERERRSVSAEVNYGIRLTTMKQVNNFLIELCKVAHKRLMEAKRKSRCAILKVMIRADGAPEEAAKYQGHGICDCVSKTINMRDYTDDLALIQRYVIATNKELQIPPKDYRGMGLIFTRLNSLKLKPNKQGVVLKEMFKRIQAKQEAKIQGPVVPSPHVKSDEGTEDSSRSDDSSDSEGSSSESENEETRNKVRTGTKGDDENEFGGAAHEGNTSGTIRRPGTERDRKREDDERRKGGGDGGDGGGGGNYKNGGSGGDQKNGGNSGGDRNGNGDKKKDKKKDDKKEKKKSKDKKKKDDKDKKDKKNEEEEIEIKETTREDGDSGDAADALGASKAAAKKESSAKKDKGATQSREDQRRTTSAQGPSTSTKKPTGLKKFFSFAKKEVTPKRKRRESHSSQEPSWSTQVDYMTYTGHTETNECNTGFSLSTERSSIPEDTPIRKDPTSMDSNNIPEEIVVMDWQDRPEPSNATPDCNYIEDIVQIIEDTVRREEGNLSTIESETFTEGEDVQIREREDSQLGEGYETPLDDTVRDDEHALIDEEEEKSQLTENIEEEDECALIEDYVDEEEEEEACVVLKENGQGGEACVLIDDDDGDETQAKQMAENIQKIADIQVEGAESTKDVETVCSDDNTVEEESECTERIPLLAVNPIGETDEESASSSDKMKLLSKHSDDEDESMTDTTDVSTCKLPLGIDPNIFGELPYKIQTEILEECMLDDPNEELRSAHVRMTRIQAIINSLPVAVQMPTVERPQTSRQAALELADHAYLQLETDTTPTEPTYQHLEPIVVELHTDPSELPGTSKSFAKFQQPTTVTMPRTRFPPAPSDIDLITIDKSHAIGMDSEYMGVLDRATRQSIETQVEIERNRVYGEHQMQEAAKISENEKDKNKGAKKKQPKPRVVSRAPPTIFSMWPQTTLRTAAGPLQIESREPEAVAEINLTQTFARETGYLPLYTPRESVMSLRECLQHGRESNGNNIFIGQFKTQISTLIRENPEPSDELVKHLCGFACQIVEINAIEYLVEPLQFLRSYARANASCSWHIAYRRIINTVNLLMDEMLRGKTFEIGFRIDCDKC